MRQSRFGGVAEVRSVSRFRRNEGEEGGEGKTRLEMRLREPEEDEDSGVESGWSSTGDATS